MFSPEYFLQLIQYNSGRSLGAVLNFLFLWRWSSCSSPHCTSSSHTQCVSITLCNRLPSNWPVRPGHLCTPDYLQIFPAVGFCSPFSETSCCVLALIQVSGTNQKTHLPLWALFHKLQFVSQTLLPYKINFLPPWSINLEIHFYWPSPLTGSTTLTHWNYVEELMW